jgi:hypothetical protein
MADPYSKPAITWRAPGRVPVVPHLSLAGHSYRSHVHRYLVVASLHSRRSIWLSVTSAMHDAEDEDYEEAAAFKHEE